MSGSFLTGRISGIYGIIISEGILMVKKSVNYLHYVKYLSIFGKFGLND
jgi:hypothetical protein